MSADVPTPKHVVCLVKTTASHPETADWLPSEAAKRVGSRLYAVVSFSFYVCEL